MSKTAARVTAKHQISIPKEVREEIGLKAGQEFWVFKNGSVITLVPVRPLESLRGIARGIDVENFREKKDRY